MIVSVNDEIKKLLAKNSEFSELFLNNCINSKFLAIEKLNSEIIAACFVGGILNSNGIEINEEFRGKGLGKKLVNEIMNECESRKISMLTGVFKPTNLISIKTHIKIGYRPVFTIFYNHDEGREIIVINPLNSKGKLFFRLWDLLGFEPVLPSLSSSCFPRLCPLSHLALLVISINFKLVIGQ